ncbi:hypothetical protein H4R19_003843, partial [Coemansia spiralis]
MSAFHYDFAKFNKAFDITNGSDTLTINSTKHVTEVCVCANCVAIMAQRAAAERAAAEKKKHEQWAI